MGLNIVQFWHVSIYHMGANIVDMADIEYIDTKSYWLYWYQDLKSRALLVL